MKERILFNIDRNGRVVIGKDDILFPDKLLIKNINSLGIVTNTDIENPKRAKSYRNIEI